MNDRPHQATTAELLDLLDGFLRTGNGVADSLRDYLDTATAERPDRPGYDATSSSTSSASPPTPCPTTPAPLP